MIEHAPWIGSEYQLGVDSQRVAIVGWSHWGDEDDKGSATIECLDKVIGGEWKIRFFTQIRSYFGYDENAIFWRRVLFFNYLPSLVGDAEQRFGHGTQKQRNVAQERFHRIIRENLPQKVFVFTSRRWAFPGKESSQKLYANVISTQIEKREYVAGSQRVPAFFLRHPQGANGDVMRRAVTYIRGLPAISE